MAEPLARAYVELTAKDLGFTKALSDAIGQAARFGVALYGLTVGLREVVKATSDYQESLALLQVEMDISKRSAERLIESVDQLREAWGYTRYETTRALAAIEDAGYNVVESMKILTEGMKVARATGSGLSETVNALASLLAGLDIGAEGAARAANVLFTIMAEGRVNLKDLDLGFARLILLGKSIGVTLEDLGAWYTALSKRTTETYNIYLALNGIMKSIISPGIRLKETIRDLGYSTGIAMIQSIGFSKALQTLIGLVESGRIKWTDLVTDVRALSGVMGALPLAMEDALELFDQLTSGTNRLDRAASTMLSTWQKQVAKFQAALENFLSTVGTPLLALLTDILKILTQALKPLTEFAKAASSLFLRLGIGVSVEARNKVSWVDLLTAVLPAIIIPAILAGSPFSIPLGIVLMISTTYQLVSAPKSTWFEEVLSRLLQAGGWALAGGTIGAAIGGPPGAALGAGIGVVANLAVNLIIMVVDVIFAKGKGPSPTEQILNYIKDLYGEAYQGLEKAIKPFSLEFRTTFKPSLIVEFSEIEQVVQAASEFIRNEAIRTDELIRRSSSKTAQEIAIAWAQAGSMLGKRLSELGVTSVDMAKAAAIAMFGGLGDYLADLPDVFWRSFLEKGSISIEEIKRQAEELGASFSNAIRTIMVGGLELTGIGDIGREIAESVNDLFYELGDSVPKGFSELFSRIWNAFSGVSTPLIDFIGVIKALLDEVSDSPFQFAALITNIKKFSDEVNKVIEIYSNAGREIPKSFQELSKALNGFVESLGKAGTVTKNLFEAVDSLARKIRESRMPLDELYRSFTVSGSSVGDLVIALRNAMASMAVEPGAIRAFIEELDQAAEWVQRTIETYMALGLTVPESLINFGAALNMVVGDISKLGDSAKGASTKLNELSMLYYLLAEIEEKRRAWLEAQTKVGLKEEQIAAINKHLEELQQRTREYLGIIQMLNQIMLMLVTQVLQSREATAAYESVRQELEAVQKMLEAVQSLYRIESEEILPRLQVELEGLTKKVQQAEEEYKEAVAALKTFTEEITSKVVSTIGDLANLPASLINASIELIKLYLKGGSVLNATLAVITAVADLMKIGAEMIKNGAEAFVEKLSWAADSILRIIGGLVTASEPYKKLTEVLSTIFNYLLNILFGFIWPIVAILEELGFKIGAVSQEISETTEEMKKIKKTLSELNVPAGFKALAMRLEYLVARPGEPYIPEEDGEKGGKTSGRTRIEFPEWVKKFTEAFKPAIEELASIIKSIAANLQSFAEAIGPSFTNLFIAVLRTLFTALNSIAGFLKTTLAPILVSIFDGLSRLWVSIIDPFIQSAVVPTLQRWLEALFVFIRDNLIPFLEKNVLPTIMNLWPKIEDFVMKIIQMGIEFLRFLDENWDKVEWMLQQWLNQGLVNIGKMFDLWRIDLLLKSGDLFGALHEVWQSRNLTFWEKILATLGSFLRPFEEGRILLGVFNIALGIVMGGLLIFKNLIDVFLGGLRILWNAFAGMINGVLAFLNWALGAIGVHINFRLPYLQEGGVVSGETLALLGEAGKEIVMPLDQFMNMIGAAEFAPKAVPELVLVNEIHLEVDGREVAYAVKQQEVKENILRGKW